MVSTVQDTQYEAAVESLSVAVAAVATLPAKGQVAVVEHLLSKLTPEDLAGLSGDAKEAMRKALDSRSAAIPTTLDREPEGAFDDRYGARAVTGSVVVNGRMISTVLSERSSNKDRTAQEAFAEGLGGRLATRGENSAYVRRLITKEEEGTINPAEKHALGTYRERCVRDATGGLFVIGRRIMSNVYLEGRIISCGGALVVCPSAESK